MIFSCVRPTCAQVVDDEDLLEELVSKLRRRRRQAAGDEEIGSLEDERLRTLARLASLRSAKLTELRGEGRLRRTGAGGHGGRLAGNRVKVTHDTTHKWKCVGR